MKTFFKITWIVCWAFCAGWAFYIHYTIGPDAIMPMRLKLPLELSFFGPLFLWLTYEIFFDYKKRLNDTIEDKMDINR